jgi:hypothetical protein
MYLDELGLSVRAYNCLRRAGINTVEDLCNKTPDDMMKVRNLGRRCLEEVINIMKVNGWKFKDEPEILNLASDCYGHDTLMIAKAEYDRIVNDRDYWEREAKKAVAMLGENQIAEEQGLLLRLPCKVGDTVYWISPFKSGINQGRIENIIMSKFGFDLVILEQAGTIKRRELEKVFLTREAAEEALQEGGEAK